MDKKQLVDKITNIIILILEEKEGYVQVDEDDLEKDKYYFAIPRSSSTRTDWTSLYIGKVNIKSNIWTSTSNIGIEKCTYFEDLHNPVTNERFDDKFQRSFYSNKDDYIFARIEYDHFSFIEKYKMSK